MTDSRADLPSWRRAQSSPKRHRTLVGLPVLAIAAVYLAVATALGAVTASALHQRSSLGGVAFSSDPPQYLVLMVLDGARPDYLNMGNLPHVAALESQGAVFTNALDGILEAETPTGHATIATGSRPDHDGILGFDWGQSDGTRFSLFNPDKMGTVEQILQDSGAPTLGSLYKKRFPAAKVVALSGHKYYAAAPLGGPAADAIMYYEGDPRGRYVPVAVPGHVPPAGVLTDKSLIYPTTHLKNGVEDNLATRLALKTVQTMRPRMLLINYPEFDWPLGHIDGGSLDRPAVVTDMQGFDSDLGQIEDLYRKDGILDKTLFVITADHGMMPITRFVPATTIDNAITQAGTTAPDIASNSADYIWLADPTKAQTVAQNIINAHDPGIASTYYLTTVNGKPGYAPAATIPADQETANQYLLGALLNGHEPTVVVFGHEGASFSDPSTNWKADHGGNTWESQHIPLILAGPGIRQGTYKSAVQLEDIAPTVLTDMGVAPSGMAGTPLTDALDKSDPTAAKARTGEIGYLNPVAAALRLADNP